MIIMSDKVKRYFPLFVDVEGNKVLIVGAGNIGFRRMKTLLEFGAEVTLLSASIGELEEESRLEMGRLIASQRVRYIARDFKDSDLTLDAEAVSPWDMVIAATNHKTLNEHIYELCREQSILVNVASDKNLCDFFFPAVAMNEEVTVGIVGDGTHHQKVKAVADNIRLLLAAED